MKPILYSVINLILILIAWVTLCHKDVDSLQNMLLMLVYFSVMQIRYSKKGGEK